MTETRVPLKPPPVQPPRVSGSVDGAPAAASLPGLPADTPVLGQAVPNDQYMGLRLVYGDGPAESLDPVSSVRFLAQLSSHWFFCFAAGFFFTFVLFVVGIRSPGALGLLWLLWIVAFSFIPVRASISEWKFMVDGKAAASGQAFEHITWVIRQRQTPVSRISVGRVKLGRGATRDYLNCRLGVFQGYVSCFPFGHDLYLGWTFWWRLSTARFWLLVIQRWFHGLTLRNSELHWILRYDEAKALREAIHSAARQGVDAASGQVSFQGEGTIGTDIPIDIVGPREGMDGLASAGLPESWSGADPARPGPSDR